MQCGRDGSADEARVGPPVRLDGLVLRKVLYRAGFEQPTHSHGSTSVTLVYAGSLEERVGTMTECAEPMSVVVKPAGTEHADRVGKYGARTLQVVLDSPEDVRKEPILDQWRWLHAGSPARAAMEVLRSLRTPNPDLALTEIAVYDFLGTLAADERLHGRGDAPSWLRQVAEQIDASFTAPPHVRTLAKSADVHPVSLARCYRRYYGTSITTCIRHRRVQAAAVRLATSANAVSHVAHATGYADQSHLCREFKRATGYTPVQYRSMARIA